MLVVDVEVVAAEDLAAVLVAALADEEAVVVVVSQGEAVVVVLAVGEAVDSAVVGEVAVVEVVVSEDGDVVSKLLQSLGTGWRRSEKIKVLNLCVCHVWSWGLPWEHMMGV